MTAQPCPRCGATYTAKGERISLVSRGANAGLCYNCAYKARNISEEQHAHTLRGYQRFLADRDKRALARKIREERMNRRHARHLVPA